ncbi:MAG: hypothetical protein AAF757_21710 [Cyanobacteria bacterium P01_D01_bin.116]
MGASHSLFAFQWFAITNYQFPVSYSQSPITNYQLPIPNYQLPITNYQQRRRIFKYVVD